MRLWKWKKAFKRISCCIVRWDAEYGWKNRVGDCNFAVRVYSYARRRFGHYAAANPLQKWNNRTKFIPFHDKFLRYCICVRLHVARRFAWYCSRNILVYWETQQGSSGRSSIDLSARCTVYWIGDVVGYLFGYTQSGGPSNFGFDWSKVPVSQSLANDESS